EAARRSFRFVEIVGDAHLTLCVLVPYAQRLCSLAGAEPMRTIAKGGRWSRICRPLAVGTALAAASLFAIAALGPRVQADSRKKGPPEGLRFEISYAKGLSDNPLDGRMFLLISKVET